MKIIIFVLILITPVSKVYTKHLKFKHLTMQAGLSNSDITSIIKDQLGYMWFGTKNGLNRYDGNEIKVFKNSKEDSTSLANNYILSFYLTNKGDLLINTSEGIQIYNSELENFSKIKFKNTSQLDLSIEQDKENNIWISNNKSICMFNEDFIKLEQKNITDFFGISPKSISTFRYDKNNFCIIADKKIYLYNFKSQNLDFYCKINSTDKIIHVLKINARTLWVCTNKNKIFIIKDKKNHSELTFNNHNTNINQKYLTFLFKYSESEVWILTDGGGIIKYNIKDKSIKRIVKKSFIFQSISTNSLTTIYKCNDNILWIGTARNGIEKQIKNSFRTILKGNNGVGLSNKEITSLFHDGENLWIGTDGNGLDVLRSNNSIKHITLPNNIKSITSLNLINNNLYIGEFTTGLFTYNIKNEKCKHKFKNQNNGYLNAIYIVRLKKKKLWIGAKSLYKIENKKDKYNFSESEFKNKFPLKIYSILLTKNGGEFLGGYNGVYECINNSFKKIISCRKAYNMIEYNDSSIWISTDNGLLLYNLKTKKITRYAKKNGLNNIFIKSMIYDNSKNIWLSTSYGISKFDVQNKTFSNYTFKDGFTDNEFSRSAVAKAPDGKIFFGGINGLLSFYPESIFEINKSKKVIFTNLFINNKKFTTHKTNLLTKPFFRTKKITINHNQRIFTIEFNSFDYSFNNKVNYSYKLIGVDNDFLTTNKNSVTYMNLEPGEYNFIIESPSISGKLNKNFSSLKINILPPWWATIYFKIATIILILVLIYIIFNFLLKRKLEKLNNENEKNILKNQIEIDESQLRFFTNLSHEIRTPLTLIMAPTNDMLKKKGLDSDMYQNLHFIEKNVLRMNRLINNSLDFRKMELRKIQVQASKLDIVKYLNETIETFSGIAKSKDIKLNLIKEINSLYFWFDPYLMETILFNLLSNAVKFTSTGGNISLRISKNDNQVIISIYDNGCGISKNDINKIFNRFYQGESQSKGTGIGLSLVKLFVIAHKGSIDVKSKIGKYTIFTIKFNIQNNIFDKQDCNIKNYSLMQQSKKNQIEINHSSIDIKRKDYSNKVILIIDDEVDILKYLEINLKSNFKILTASNGTIAQKIIMNNIIHLIISDVMMPEMDGVELLQWIKSKDEYHNIPIILLTAKTLQQNKTLAYSKGADSYIIKPFSIDLVLSRIYNLLDKTEYQKTELHKKLVINDDLPNIWNSDNEFLKRSIDIVEQNISVIEFDSYSFSSLIGMSRSNTYRKMFELTKLGVKEFIIIVRLSHAAYMLINTNKRITEISDLTGFNTSSYFSTCFKKRFKMAPSLYKIKYKDVTTSKNIFNI